ncbi:MAG: 50S ribosomal protein L6 [Anaerohalosphaera sp.]|nr:50S ribosomal protein L6 [Anaerohalosphaera sp.]
MSRIGKKPVEIPAGVTVDCGKDVVKVTGPKGTVSVNRLAGIEVKIDEGAKQIVVSNPNQGDSNLRAFHGTMRSHLFNMVTGVSKGFEKKMQIFGTGYNIKEQGGKVVLNVGYCHSVELATPKSVTVEIKTPATRGNDVPALFTLKGFNKQELGQFAAEIRKVRPPEPYKGKGIRYADEEVRRKEGKAFSTGG